MQITLYLWAYLPFVRNSVCSDEELLEVPSDVVDFNGRPVELPDVSNHRVDKRKSFLEEQSHCNVEPNYSGLTCNLCATVIFLFARRIVMRRVQKNHEDNIQLIFQLINFVNVL